MNLTSCALKLTIRKVPVGFDTRSGVRCMESPVTKGKVDEQMDIAQETTWNKPVTSAQKD